MSDGSTIEWLQRPGTKPASWNPIVAYRDVAMEHVGVERLRGWHCEHVHEGCVNCYAERQNETGRFMGTRLPYKPGHRASVQIELHEPTLLAPLKWRQPRTIFVCSMTDLYGDWVKDEWLDKIKAVQALTPQHTYIELTKRPERMREYLGVRHSRNEVELAAERIKPGVGTPFAPKHSFAWPLPNVWGLVSCSTQEDADKFIPEILQTPLAVRGVSYEPALGPMDLNRVSFGEGDPRHKRDALTGQARMYGVGVNGNPDMTVLTQLAKPMTRLDWVICGGESGPNARPMNPQWARDVRDQCADAGVPFFFKQWGEYAPAFDKDLTPRSLPWNGADQTAVAQGRATVEQATVRVGKKAAGRLLDGREHNEFPDSSVNVDSDFGFPLTRKEKEASDA